MSNISFKVNDNGKIINVKYSGEITCEQFIVDFTSKNANLGTSDPNIYTFKANGKILNSPLFKNKQLKEIVKDQQIVYFVRKKNMSYSKK